MLKNYQIALNTINLIFLVLTIILSCISIFGLTITSGWSKETAVSLDASKFFISSIVIIFAAIILFFIMKRSYILSISGILVSVLLYFAEITAKKSPYLNDTTIFHIFTIILFIFCITKFIVDLMFLRYTV